MTFDIYQIDIVQRHKYLSGYLLNSTNLDQCCRTSTSRASHHSSFAKAPGAKIFFRWANVFEKGTIWKLLHISEALRHMAAEVQENAKLS